MCLPFRPAALVALSILLASPPSASFAAATIMTTSVGAAVISECSISAGSVAFGNYDPLGANATSNLDVSGGITVACTKGAPNVTISLDNGSHFAAPNRQMSRSGSSDLLQYQLYADSSRTTVWNTSNKVAYTSTSAAPQRIPIYGRIFAGQDVSTGSYSDSVIATVNF